MTTQSHFFSLREYPKSRFKILFCLACLPDVLLLLRKHHVRAATFTSNNLAGYKTGLVRNQE